MTTNALWKKKNNKERTCNLLIRSQVRTVAKKGIRTKGALSKEGRRRIHCLETKEIDGSVLGPATQAS